MHASTIHAWLSPPDVRASQAKALSLIDAQFTSLDDLDGIEAESSKAQARREELESKLSASKASLDIFLENTRKSVRNQETATNQLSVECQLARHDLSYLASELLSSISDNATQPTILEDIETLHRNLTELSNIKEYVEILDHTLHLSQRATEQPQSLGPTDTLTPVVLSDYRSLHTFAQQVKRACSSVEDASGQQTLRLVTWVEGILHSTWLRIKNDLFTTLLDAAEKLGWPSKMDLSTTSKEDRQRFEHAFFNLIQLQDFGEQLNPDTREGLYPLEAMVRPLAQRFKFHFEGNRETNKLEKPEWYFTHVLNNIQDHRQFMESSIQPLITPTQYAEVDAWREFTYLSLSMPVRKLKRTIPLLLSYPSLLAHTVYQALAFDAALIDSGFHVSRTSGSKDVKEDGSWVGISEIILSQKEWFDAWLEGERKFVQDQYHDIIGSQDAWMIANDDGEADSRAPHDLRSTNSARRIKALVEQVTDRYSPLRNFTQKTSFLTNVQLPIMEWYHGRISASLDAFETLSSAFVRAVPGALGVSLGRHDEATIKVDTRRLTTGVEGVQRLCKALLSAKYLEMAMAAWGEETFFLELWVEINRRASLRNRAEHSSVLPDPKALLREDELPQDTIFQELVAQYSKLVSRAEDMIVQQVSSDVESGLKAHFNQVQQPSAEQDIAVSQTLLGPLALLSSYIQLLKSSLPETTVFVLYRRITSHIAEHILHRQILFRGNIPENEAKLISAECELWVQTCRIALGSSTRANRAEAPWREMLQAGRLIGLEREKQEQVLRLMYTDDDWEGKMTEIIGFCEMDRENVMRVLKIVNH